MNVIDLLPDHPRAPQRQSFKALLPNLMCKAIALLKSFVVSYVDDAFRRNTLQRARESCDISITRIQYEVKVIWHKNIRDQLTWPVKQEMRASFEEYFTASILLKDGNAVQNVAGDEMQCARKIYIGPLFSHEESL